MPWLTDRKWAYIRMEGTSFGDVPLNVELKLEVWDSPNSAGIVIDAVRLAKLALNNGVAGALEGPSAYLMKSPPKQIADDDAYDLVERFIKQNRRKVKEPAKAVVRLRRIFLLGAAALATVAALVAIAAVLNGDFGETEGKLFATLAATFVAGSTAIAGIAVLARGVSRPLGVLGVVLAARRLRAVGGADLGAARERHATGSSCLTVLAFDARDADRDRRTACS